MEWVIPTEWQDAAAAILTAPQRPVVVLVVGSVDSGKTTFCTWLANEFLRQGLGVSVIDADLGQSDIGLPTTLGVGFPRRSVGHLREIKCEKAYFVGSTSPVGHLLPVMVGTKRLLDWAIAKGVNGVLVDTDGLVWNGSGISLKQYQFELLQPTHVVLLEKRRELEHFFRMWNSIQWTRVFRLPVSSAVVGKSPEQRRQYREQRFREWLAGCREMTFSIDRVRFRNTWLRQGWEWTVESVSQRLGMSQREILYAEQMGRTLVVLTSDSDFVGRREDHSFSLPEGIRTVRWASLQEFQQVVVGLLDSQDELMGVALAIDLDFSSRRLRVLSPPIVPARVRTIVFGSLRVDRNGTELGILSPRRF